MFYGNTMQIHSNFPNLLNVKKSPLFYLTFGVIFLMGFNCPAQNVTITVSKHNLPGEFVLRFDYKDNETSTPYPSEKHIVISNQNLELWVNPPYCNNEDSAHFQKGEKENSLFARFSKENGKQKSQLALLQNFLTNYDNAQSKFYQQGIEEYEKRRSKYNQWIREQSTQYNALFISHRKSKIRESKSVWLDGRLFLQGF